MEKKSIQWLREAFITLVAYSVVVPLSIADPRAVATDPSTAAVEQSAAMLDQRSSIENPSIENPSSERPTFITQREPEVEHSPAIMNDEAERQPLAFSVRDDRVFGSINQAPSLEILQQISESAGIKLAVVGEVSSRSSLTVEGLSLLKTLETLFPDNTGLVAKYDDGKRLVSVTIYTGQTKNAALIEFRPAASERQQYISRQTGTTDDGAVEIMRQTLSGEKAGTTPEKLAALLVLKDIESESARQLVEASAADTDVDVRVAALKAMLEQIGEYDAIRLITQNFFQGTAEERKRIAELVSQSEHPAARYILSEMHNQSGKQVAQPDSNSVIWGSSVKQSVPSH